MSTPYPYPYPPNSDNDAASQRLSRTSHSQQPAWSLSPPSTSRTYFDPLALRYSPSKSVSRTYFATQHPTLPPQSSAVTAPQPHPQPNPAYSDSFYQPSLPDAGAGVEQDSRFNFGRPDMVSGDLQAPPPRPSPSHDQQPREADASTQRGLSRSVGQFFEGMKSPKQRIFGVDGFEAASPPLPSSGEQVFDERGRDSALRSAQYPNSGPNPWGSRVEEESKGLPPPRVGYEQWGAQTNAWSRSGGSGSEFYYDGTQGGY